MATMNGTETTKVRKKKVPEIGNWKRLVGQRIRRMSVDDALTALATIESEGVTTFHPTIRRLSGGLNSPAINDHTIRRLARRAGVTGQGLLTKEAASRKGDDFVALAELLKRGIEMQMRLNRPAGVEAIATTACAMADFLNKSRFEFDRSKFLAAAGIIVSRLNLRQPDVDMSRGGTEVLIVRTPMSERSLEAA